MEGEGDGEGKITSTKIQAAKEIDPVTPDNASWVERSTIVLDHNAFRGGARPEGENAGETQVG